MMKLSKKRPLGDHPKISASVKTVFLSVALLLMLHDSGAAFAASAESALRGCVPEVKFSPDRGAMDLVIRLIDAAGPGQEIDVEAYEFTSRRMTRALRAALLRGASLKLAVDAGQNVGKSYSRAYEFLNTAGAEVRYEDRWQIFHEKVTIVPALNAYEEGSMNYTDSGDTRNRENANLTPNCPQNAALYKADFDDAWAQGTPLH